MLDGVLMDIDVKIFVFVPSTCKTQTNCSKNSGRVHSESHRQQ